MALAFHFFNFLDLVKQTVHGFLSSVLAQLWIRLQPDDIPSKITRNIHYGRTQPSTEDLFHDLLETLSRFKEVYIIIDALDECNLDERQRLFHLITRLQDLNDSNLHLLMTSRRNSDVQEAMSILFPLEISIDTEPVINDIEVYLQKEMQTDERLSLYDESFKSRIIRTLIEGSDGW